MTTLHPGTARTYQEAVSIRCSDRIGASEWDRLARRGFHRHRWTAVAERSGWSARHVAVYGPAGLRSVIPAYLTSGGTAHDLHDRWLGPLGRSAARVGLSLRPVVSVQSAFGPVSEPTGDGTELPSSLLHQAFEALESTARDERAKAVVWPFVEATNRLLLEVARERGYGVFYAGAAARLPIRWESFEEYLASRSKSVRRTIRADLAQIRAAELGMESTSDFLVHAAGIDNLYRKAFQRRNGRPTLLASDFFSRLAKSPDRSVTAQLTWNGTRLVGSSMNLAAAGRLDGTFAAFTREHHGGAAYFNDLVYQPIRHACKEGIGTIELGPTALYAKVLRGATLQRRVVLIRGRTPPLHAMLCALGRMVALREERKDLRALGALWGPRCFPEREDAP
ncbi:MAG: GNAT family N-acetyltransferase [Gemmatimonadales bacterium]